MYWIFGINTIARWWRVQMSPKHTFGKNDNILSFGINVECIQISTNKPSIGSIICEIGFKIWEQK